MTTRSPYKTLNNIMSILIIFVMSACATATAVPPTETSIAETSTPEATSPPTDTPTPEATSTPTSTATITPTHTPAGTPTQIPEFSPAAEGMGNVVGLILWNDQPFTNTWVRLCEDFDSWDGCVGNNPSTKSDQNGYFVFQDVAPGEYLVTADLFGTSWWQFYIDSQESRMHKVSAGENLILDPWHIYKLDLGVISPKIEKSLSEEKPTFKWDAYPDAAYYEISVYNDKYEWILESKRVDGNEFTPEEPMVSCKYWWYVEVFNTQGTKIARSDPPPTGDYDWYFTLYDLPSSCEQKRD